MKKKVCIVTGTRAEYGILRPLIEKLDKESSIELQIIATGMHLSPEFGLTYKNIEQDGYNITEKIEILLSSDSSVGVSKSMGLALISFAECYQRINPDLIIILGDRYETFSAMAAATVAKIPVAHLHGGEITEGAFDDSFRHSMTKMAYLHFTSAEEYSNRVIQLGENPDRVFNVGAMGVENVLKLKLSSRDELEKKLEIELKEGYFTVVFHPVTLENNSAEDQVNELMKALDEFKGKNIVFIKGNSDTNGRIINSAIDNYCINNSNAFCFASLHIEDYMSLLKNSSCIIGNSSSGIIEAPSFKIATINIGDRQKGRIKAQSVIDCKPNAEEIVSAINIGIDNNFKNIFEKIENPYGNGETSEKIHKIIKEFLFDKEINLKKKFYNIKFEV